MKKYLNKLHYRSWHRGTKESDLFLGKFFDKYGEKLLEIDIKTAMQTSGSMHG